METIQNMQPGVENRMDPEPDYDPVYPGCGRLDGKRVLITGGDSGIGRAVAILFAREGADIAIVYGAGQEDTDAEKTRELVEAEGGKAILLRGDVGDKSFCEHAVGETIERLGGLDVVIPNAAEQHAQEAVTDISEEQLRRTFQTNIFGQIFLVQAALPHLKPGACIICTTSVTAYRGQDLLVDYASTKGAILALVRALAHKLADKGIRVNGVAPGPVWTPLIPASFPPEKVAHFGENTPLGRCGQPNEVAPSFLFLACQDSSYMTGQVLHPNGGEAVSG